MWRRARSRKQDRERGNEIFQDLRGGALGLDPVSAGITPSDRFPAIFGGMMDMGFPEGTATLVGLADGTTSVYMSSGAGIIGGGEHEAVASRTFAFLDELERCHEQLNVEDEPGLPSKGMVCLRALRYDGVRALIVAEDELGAGEHPLSPVFLAGHEVIAAVRELDEGRG